MTDTEQRFALSMRQVDDDEPGLIRERDGTVWLVNPDGTRTQLPGEGNGGSLPDEWTVDPNGSLAIQTDDTEARILLRNSGDLNATVDSRVSDEGGGAVSAILQVESDGGGIAQVFVTRHGGDENSVVLDGHGTVDAYTADGSKSFTAWDSPGNVLRFAILPGGQIMTGALAAPADGDLAAGQVALWFDDTNGAAKLMLKGKSANGTVVTGEVALA